MNRIRKIAYPFEYFDAQVKFAKKWSTLSNNSLSSSLLHKTALHRRLTLQKPSVEGTKEWKALSKKIEAHSGNASIIFWNYFLKLPHRYFSIKHQSSQNCFNYFCYEYNSSSKLIRIHFNILSRGIRSGFAKENLLQRQIDLKGMFCFIKLRHPDAVNVVSGSWLYNLDAGKRMFPQQFTRNPRFLKPPEYNFGGDSSWGQLIDSYGAPKMSVYNKLLDNIEKASTIDDLIKAFPYPAIEVKSPITIFYNFYDC